MGNLLKGELTPCLSCKNLNISQFNCILLGISWRIDTFQGLVILTVEVNCFF